MTKPSLFDPAVLDQLEGLNERYAKLSARIEELEARIDAGVAFDLPPDTAQLGSLVDTRRRVEVTKFSEGKEAVALLETLLNELREAAP